MEAVLWYVLTGTRGGPNRVRILRALDRHPRNANRLAESLDLDYKTVRHHLDVLVDNSVVVSSGDDYGAVYVPSGQARTQWDTVETIFERVDAEPEDATGTADTGSTTDSETDNGPDA